MKKELVVNYNIDKLEKALNSYMPKKYEWFKNIIIYQVLYYEKSKTLAIYGDILVDEDWYGNQFRKYHYSSYIIDPNIENVSIGDIVGGPFANELANTFRNVYRGATGIKPVGFQWINLNVSIPEKNNDETMTEKTLDESILKVLQQEIENVESLNEIYNNFSIQRRLKEPIDRDKLKSLVKQTMYLSNVFDYSTKYYYLYHVADEVVNNLMPFSNDNSYTKAWNEINEYIIEEFGNMIKKYWIENNYDDDSELYENEELKEKCWKGYTQKGMKTMFGKRYPNCIKKSKK